MTQGWRQRLRNPLCHSRIDDCLDFSCSPDGTPHAETDSHYISESNRGTNIGAAINKHKNSITSQIICSFIANILMLVEWNGTTWTCQKPIKTCDPFKDPQIYFHTSVTDGKVTLISQYISAAVKHAGEANLTMLAASLSCYCPFECFLLTGPNLCISDFSAKVVGLMYAEDHIKYQHSYFCPISLYLLAVNRNGRQMLVLKRSSTESSRLLCDSLSISSLIHWVILSEETETAGTRPYTHQIFNKCCEK